MMDNLAAGATSDTSDNKAQDPDQLSLELARTLVDEALIKENADYQKNLGSAFQDDLVVLRAAFPDLQFAIKRAPESGSMREEFVGPSMSGVSRADFQWHMVALVLSLEGTHQGDFMGIPPTGKKVTVDCPVIFNVSVQLGTFGPRGSGNANIEVAACDVFGLLRQLK